MKEYGIVLEITTLETLKLRNTLYKNKRGEIIDGDTQQILDEEKLLNEYEAKEGEHWDYFFDAITNLYVSEESSYETIFEEKYPNLYEGEKKIPMNYIGVYESEEWSYLLILEDDEPFDISKLEIFQDTTVKYNNQILELGDIYSDRCGGCSVEIRRTSPLKEVA
jgi:hypothetical protein